MPAFVRALQNTSVRDQHDRGWVDQFMAARRVIESEWGIELIERRISTIDMAPLFGDLLIHAERFRSVYNGALASYRRAQRIRGTERPVPDLAMHGQLCELPIWVDRKGKARRRLFVERSSGVIRLFADHDEIAVIDSGKLTEGRRGPAEVIGGWRLRPRALSLTLWARLFLADLFIHGIGGAKYDRITDAIIQEYFGIEPPRLACVSATLLLDLPRADVNADTIRRLERDIRDLRYNPQRHLAATDDLRPLFDQRAAAVRESDELRESDPDDRTVRREVFRRIRSLNDAIAGSIPEASTRLAKRIDEARSLLVKNRLANGREYFFGLHSRDSLTRLLETLPPSEAFAV